MGVDERHARQLPGSGARQEAVHWVCEINDVLIVKSVALESPQGTDTILEEAPGHGGARYWIDGFVKVVEDGGRENGTQGAGVFEFPETVNIEILPPGELVETIGIGRPRMAGKPAVPNGKIGGECVIDGHCLAGVVPHDLSCNGITIQFGMTLYETIHLATVDGVVHRFVPIGRTRSEAGLVQLE